VYGKSIISVSSLKEVPILESTNHRVATLQVIEGLTRSNTFKYLKVSYMDSTESF